MGHRVAAKLVAIRVDPEELTRRITARVRAWLAEGWLDEVRGLVERGYGDARAMGSVGYREVHAALIGRMPKAFSGCLFQSSPVVSAV